MGSGAIGEGVIEGPRELRVNAAAHALEITWSDATRDAVRFSTLRERCRCAECRSLRQKHMNLQAPADITLTDLVPYGPNAVQLVFSDGHSRGIFPFSYLRELASGTASTADSR